MRTCFKILFVAFLLPAMARAQWPVKTRGDSSLINVDYRLLVGFNLGIPVYDDTASALHGGKDVLGLVVQIRSTGDWYKRDTVLPGGHQWTKFGTGSGSTFDTTTIYQHINLKLDSIRRKPGSDSIFGYANGNRVFQFKDTTTLTTILATLGYAPLAPSDTLNLHNVATSKLNAGDTLNLSHRDDTLATKIRGKLDTGTTYHITVNNIGGGVPLASAHDSVFNFWTLLAGTDIAFDTTSVHGQVIISSSGGGGGSDSGFTVQIGPNTSAVPLQKYVSGGARFIRADTSHTNPAAIVTQSWRKALEDSLNMVIDSILAKINKKAYFITGTGTGVQPLTYVVEIGSDTAHVTKGIELKADSGYPLIDALQTTDSAVVFNIKDTVPGVSFHPSGLILVDSTQQIGDIYNKSTWSSLADFTQTGSGASFTASGGKIEVPTSSSAVLALNDATMLDQDAIAMDFVYTNFTGTDYGLTYGWASIGSSGQSQVSVYMYVVGITGSDLGKIDLFQQVNGGSPTQHLSAGHLTSIITGDTITYNLKSNAGTFSGYARNHRTGDTVSISVPGNFLDSGISHNTAQVAILAGNTASGSTEEIQSLRHYSWAPAHAVVVQGVSIDYGDVAGSVANRYITKAHLVTSSGVGDISAMGLAHLKELWKFYKPKAVFTEIATNDVGFAISIGTTEANLTANYDTLTTHDIPAYFLLCPPRNDVNVTTINTWIRTNYPGKYIDLYTPLWAGTGTGMASIYNSGDGVHPDSLGHDVMYRTIIADSLYQKYANDGWLSYYDDPGIPSSTTKDNTIPNIGWIKRYAATAFIGGGSGGDSITGSGTTNKLTKFTGTTVIGNSGITDNGTNISTTETFNAGSIGIGVTPSYPLDFGGYRTAGFQMHYGDLGFQSYNADNNYIFTNSQNVSGTYKYVNTGSASMIQTGSTPGMLFNVAPSGSAGTAITFIPMLQIVPAGRILFNAIGDNGVDQFQFYGTSKFYGLINYSGNFASSYTIRSPTDKGYVDSAIAAYVAAHPGGDDSTNMASKHWADSVAQHKVDSLAAAVSSPVKYSQTASGTALTNSTSSISIMGTGTGSLTLAANSLSVGQVITLHGFAQVSTAASSPGTLGFNPRIGGTGWSTTSTPTVSLTNSVYEITMTFTVTATGTSGSVFPTLTIFPHGSSSPISILAGSPLTVNTTGTLAIDLFADWSTASSSNSIQSLPMFTLKVE